MERDVPVPRRNIEFKARARDLARAAEAAIRLGAERLGLLIQTDTYFAAAQARLKLREIESQSAELISYRRLDSIELRNSIYHVVPVTDPGAMKAALAAALGVRGIVRKRRELLMWHNIRIHLDQVDRLGAFIEFEAVMESDGDEDSLKRLDTLTAALGIDAEDRVSRSYIDLLEA